MNKALKFIKSKSNIIIAICVILCAIMLLVPILKIARYNMPSADDYGFSTETHIAWKSTHNIFNVLKEGFINVADTYKTWQGTFSAIFLFSLQPSLFGVQFYSITTYVLLFTLLLSNICFIKTIGKKLFNYTKKSAVFIISIILTITAIQMLPDPTQSLFWWNGAIYYTFFYSIMLLSISVIINIITSKIKVREVISYTILGILLSIFVAGGNYPTALSYCLILALITLSLFITKNKKKYLLLSITTITLIAFAISMIAPGNAVRQANCDNSLGAIKSIFVAISEGTNFIINWTNIIVIMVFIILVPFIYQVVKMSKFKFKYPLIFTIISLGVFYSQLVPPLYAMNFIGEGRLIDMVYYSYYLLILLNIGYYIGWIKEKFGEHSIKLLEYINERIILYVIFCFTLLIIFCFPTKYYKNFTSYKALDSLSTGEASDYYDEMIERYKILENDDIKDAALKPLKNYPELLFCVDFNVDKDHWINTGSLEYFNKNSIYVEN